MNATKENYRKLSEIVRAALSVAEEKMDKAVTELLLKKEEWFVDSHMYEPSLSDFLDALGENAAKFADIDYLYYSDRTERLHTDFLRYAGSDEADKKVVIDYHILSKDEYNETICANCDSIRFKGFTLVVILDEYYLDDDVEEAGTPLHCLQKIAASEEEEGKYWISNKHGRDRSFSVEVEGEE